MRIYTPSRNRSFLTTPIRKRSPGSLLAVCAQISVTKHSRFVQEILKWRHTGFNIHSQVKTQTKSEAERVGKYMIRPLELTFEAEWPPPPHQQGFLWQPRKKRSISEGFFVDFLTTLLSLHLVPQPIPRKTLPEYHQYF
jgi:hypothetical protein